MRKLTTSTGVKLVAAVLLTVMLMMTVLSYVGTAYIFNTNMINDDYDNFAKSIAYSSSAKWDAFDYGVRYRQGSLSPDGVVNTANGDAYRQRYNEANKNTNLHMQIYGDPTVAEKNNVPEVATDAQSTNTDKSVSNQTSATAGTNNNNVTASTTTSFDSDRTTNNAASDTAALSEDNRYYEYYDDEGYYYAEISGGEDVIPEGGEIISVGDNDYNYIYQNGTEVTLTNIIVNPNISDLEPLGYRIVKNGDGEIGVNNEIFVSALYQYSDGYSVLLTLEPNLQILDEYYLMYHAYKILYPLRNVIIIINIVLTLITLALIVFLGISAGRRPEGKGTSDADRQYADGAENPAGLNMQKRIAANTDLHGEGENYESANSGIADTESADSAQRNTYTENSNVNKSQSDVSENHTEIGHKKAPREKQTGKGFIIKARWLDLIPFDLFLAFMATAITLIACFAVYTPEMMNMKTFVLAYSATAVAGATVLGILTAMSSIVRFKLGKWWRNTIVYMFCAWIWHLVCGALGKIFGKNAKTAGREIGNAAGTAGRGIRNAVGKFGKAVKDSVKHIAVQWKLAVLTILVILVNIFIGSQMVWYGNGFFIFLGAVVDIIVVLGVVGIGMMLRRLQKGGRALAEGKLDTKVDTDNMLGDFKEHAENLNNISSGMALAIEDRMRSERLKTELITNVSHDIKTPLTSIVNYVDLLKKENLDGKPGEYVDVLERQSARLKKLTEDLVEASKASTGNINVELKQIDIREIVNQAVGEYNEKLAKAGLDAIVDAPENLVMAMADGRLLWRVIDNLLSNACKYSMSGTRVYVTVVDDADTATTGAPHPQNPETTARRTPSGRVTVTVRNISRDRLNIPADELMERFVRGDSSRTSSTDGSGLGLNIARSLTEIQNGSFSLSIDGDLFKAQIALRK